MNLTDVCRELWVKTVRMIRSGIHAAEMNFLDNVTELSRSEGTWSGVAAPSHRESIGWCSLRAARRRGRGEGGASLLKLRPPQPKFSYVEVNGWMLNERVRVRLLIVFSLIFYIYSGFSCSEIFQKQTELNKYKNSLHTCRTRWSKCNIS